MMPSFQYTYKVKLRSSLLKRVNATNIIWFASTWRLSQTLNVKLSGWVSCVSDCPLCPHMNGQWHWRHSKAPPTTLVYFRLVDALLAATDGVTSAEPASEWTPWQQLPWCLYSRILWLPGGWKWPHPNKTRSGSSVHWLTKQGDHFQAMCHYQMNQSSFIGIILAINKLRFDI